MLPNELVTKNFTFPFELHDHQKRLIDLSPNYERMLIGDDVGYGKTAAATGIALYDALVNDTNVIMILAPPILLLQWRRWLESIPELKGMTRLYRGTKKQRAAMQLTEPIILLSYNIFRNDFLRIEKLFSKTKMIIIADELSLKDEDTKTHRFLRKLLYGRLKPGLDTPCKYKLIALNATPTAKRDHIYPWVSAFAPGVYASRGKFLDIHAAMMDDYGTVLAWKEIELMDSNFHTFFVKSPEDAISLPEKQVIPVYLELTGKHRKMYDNLVDRLMSELPERLTELAARSMFSTLQRMLIAPEQFDIGGVKPPIHEWLEEYMEEIGDERAIIFTQFTYTIESLLAFITPERGSAVYGKVTGTARDEAFHRFETKQVQFFLCNIAAGGKGLNLQYCRRVVMGELPYTGEQFRQAFGRVYRDGQRRECFVHVPVCAGTIQERIYKRMIMRDEDIASTTWTTETIRDMIVSS